MNVRLGLFCVAKSQDGGRTARQTTPVASFRFLQGERARPVNPSVFKLYQQAMQKMNYSFIYHSCFGFFLPKIRIKIKINLFHESV